RRPPSAWPTRPVSSPTPRTRCSATLGPPTTDSPGEGPRPPGRPAAPFRSSRCDGSRDMTTHLSPPGPPTSPAGQRDNLRRYASAMKWIIVVASVLASAAAAAIIACALVAEFPSDEQRALDTCTDLAGVEIIDPVIAQRGSDHHVSGSIDLGSGPVPFRCDT